MTNHLLALRESQFKSESMLPFNSEAERALLGAILMNNRAFESVGEYLASEHFADPVNARVYEACVKLIAQGLQANPISLKTHLENDEIIIAAGGMKFLVGLAGSAVTIINASEYGQLIYDLYLRRELIALGHEMMSETFETDGPQSAFERADSAAARIDALIRRPEKTREIPLGDAVSATLKIWEAHDRSESNGVSTGLGALDACVALGAGDLVFIAGNTSMGKTALALTVAYNAAKAFQISVPTTPKKVAFFTLEMTNDQLASRYLTAETGIPGPRQRQEPLDQFQWSVLSDAERRLCELPLVLQFVPGLTLQSLRQKCRRLSRRSGGLGLVVIDYLQIMGVARGERWENRVQQISALTMGLKTLAGELGCPVLVLSQLSRENWKRDNPRPILPDLRDSGSLEQDADSILFCYREEYFLERARPERKENETGDRFAQRFAAYEARLDACRGAAEVIVAKNRHGAPGTAQLRFDAARAWFSDTTLGNASAGVGREEVTLGHDRCSNG